MDKMIGLACDHAAYEMKEFLLGWLSSKGYDVVDYGCMSEERVDYPDHAHALAKGILSGEVSRGIAMCGSGVGISIALNRHAGIRAGLSWMPEIAELTRAHNDSNVLAMPARFIDYDMCIEITKRWLETEFEGGRHSDRIKKIEEV